MFCFQCGSQVQPGSNFCSVCGAAVNSAVPAPPPVSQPVPQPSYEQPAPLVEIDPKTGLPFSHRSKVVAGLLQIFLGGFGIGRFYTGHVGIALAQIAVSFFTCGLGLIWPLVDGIILIAGDSRDADGRPLRG